MKNLTLQSGKSFSHSLRLIFMVVLCSPLISYSQGVTDTLNWSGGWCSLCGGPTGNYACMADSQNWNNGEGSFTDPLSIGDTVKQVSVKVYYNSCNLDSFAIELNGVNVGTVILPPDTACACGTCLTISVSKIEPTGFPGYIYGGTNVLKLIPYTNDSLTCVSQAIITLNGPTVPTGILKTKFDGPSDLKIYPNPTGKEFIVEMDLAAGMDLTIKLFNINGQEVFNKSAYHVYGKFKETIDMLSYAKGIYAFRITYPYGSIEKKVIVE